MAIYVTAVPAGGSGTIAVGPPLHVQVADRRTLNSGGVLPLALAVPAALAVIAVTARRRALPSRRGSTRGA
jgi:glyoxylate carboligase